MPYRELIGVPGPSGSLAVNDTDPSSSDVATAISTHASLVSGVHGLLPTAVVDQDYYIDGVGGDDSHDGLTKLTALATINGYFEKYGTELAPTSKARLHLAGTGGADPWVTPTTAQTYTEDAINLGLSAYVPNSRVIRGPQNMVLAGLVTGNPTAAMDNPPARIVDATGAANPAGLRTEILCVGAAPGWTANTMGPRSLAAFVRVTRAGEKRIFELPIADNTASSIIVDSLGIVGNIAHDDTLEIVLPGAHITGATDLGGGYVVTVIRGAGGLPGTIVAAPTASSQGASFQKVTLKALVLGAETLSFDRVRFINGVNLVRSSVYVANCSSNGKLEVSDGGRAESGQPSRPDSATDPATVTATVTLMAKQVSVMRSATVEIDKPLSAYGSADDGLIVTSDGLFVQMSASAYLGGDNNSSYGINANTGGKVRVRGGVNTAITGTTNDLLVASGLVCAYGTGAGQFEEAIGYNGNLHNTTVAAGVPSGDFSRIYV